MITDSLRIRQPASAYLPLLVPVAGYGIFIGESLFAPPSAGWTFVLFLWTVAAGTFGWWLTTTGGNRLLDWLDRHATGLAVAMIVIAGVAFITVSVLQARYFALSAHAEDTAYYSQILWNTLHGHFLSGNVQQARLFNPPVSNDLALHVSPVLVLGLLPVYALVPHFLTLLIVRDIVLAAAAWPLFVLARDRIGGTAGVAAVILYLANPVVIAQGVEAFYLLHLAPLPFFYALLAFEREDLTRFICWMATAVAVREDVAITMAGFGLWALARRRRRGWAFAGLAFPVAWFALTTLVIQPAFGRWGNNVVEIAWAKGSQPRWGLLELVRGNPLWIIDTLRHGGLDYLYRMLRSVGFVGVAGWEGLVALPGLAANLALARAFYSGTDPISRFALLSACALVGASVVVVSRIGRRPQWDVRVLAVVALVLLPSASLMDGVKDAIRSRLALYTVRNDAAALRDAVGRIPPKASVAAPNYLLPAVASRRELYYVTYLDMYPPARIDYILLDRNSERVTMNPQLRGRYLAWFGTLAGSNEYETVWQRGEYALLSRRASD